MIRLQTLFSAALLTLGAAVPTSAPRAGDYVVAGAVNRIADRCAVQFGEGFFDSGNGVCTRIREHTRIYVAPRGVGMNNWAIGGTSNAAARSSDDTAIMPGAPTQHLRVRGSLDSYNPFR